jgi:hypothetical protein
VGGAPTNCDDGNVCTTDTCAPATGCAHAFNTAPCEDGNLCTTGDRCISGSCASGTAVVCNDNVQCTVDACQPAKGCVYTPDNTRCNDNQSCTKDSCDAVKGCVFTALPDGTTCNDNNPGTQCEVCKNGLCGGGVTNYVLNLPGGNARATTPNNSNFTSCFTGAFTVEAQVRFPNTPSASVEHILTRVDSSVYAYVKGYTNSQFEVGCMRGTGSPGQFTGIAVYLGSSLAGAYHHVVCEYMGSSTDQDPIIYVDGFRYLPSIYVKMSLSQAPGNNVFVGYSANWIGTSAMAYRIDELRLSRVARYTAPFTAPTMCQKFGSDNNVCGLWHFDQNAGSTTFPDVSNQQSRTLYGQGGAVSAVQ